MNPPMAHQGESDEGLLRSPGEFSETEGTLRSDGG